MDDILEDQKYANLLNRLKALPNPSDDKSTDELNRLLVENSDLSKHNVSNVLSSANLYTHLPSEHSSHQKFVCCGSCRQWLQVLLFVPLSLVDLLHDHQICAMLGRFYAGSCSF